MAHTLSGGSKESFPDSMAEMIEMEIDKVRGQYQLNPLTSENKEDLRPLLLGISRGIVRYLGEHPDAFVISNSTVGGHGTHQHSGSLAEIKTSLPS